MCKTTARKQITAATVEEAERLLDIVVDELRSLAAGEGTHGILVIRTGPGRFTVELSEDVPYGVTEEAVADHTDS
jgi:CHASE3 domain sensor protein